MNNIKAFRLRALVAMALVLVMTVLTACGNKVKLPDEYQYEDLTKYIKLGEYKNLGIEKTEVKLSQAEIMEYIDAEVAESASTTQVKEGVVTTASTVVVDYVGRINGKKFDGGTGSDVEITIANGGFIDGFLEAMIGANVGDTVKANCVFPSDYASSDLAGKSAVFTIKIKALVVSETPEYNEEWVKKNTKFKTTSAYEESVKEILTEQAEAQELYNRRLALITKIEENSEVIKYPKKELELRYKEYVVMYKQLATDNDLDFSTLLQSSMGMTEDQFYAAAKDAAKQTVKRELILHRIAELEGVEISEKEYGEYLSTVNNSTNAFHQLLYEKVMDAIMD